MLPDGIGHRRQPTSTKQSCLLALSVYERGEHARGLKPHNKFSKEQITTSIFLQSRYFASEQVPTVTRYQHHTCPI
jgi:hypothetical protein